MRITESRIRQIIREETRRVMSEQGAAQQAGAALDAGVSTAAANLSASATPQQIEQAAVGITDALLASPGLAVLRITPGGRDFLLKSVRATLTERQQVLQKVFSVAGAPMRMITVITELVTSGQIQGIVTRLMGQNKGYAEIAGAVIDAAVARLG